MSILLKCAACGHKVPFQDDDIETEAICPSCEVLLRRRSHTDLTAIPVSMALPENFEPADLQQVPKPSGLLFNRSYGKPVVRAVTPSHPVSDGSLMLARAVERLAIAIENSGLAGHESEVLAVYEELAESSGGVSIPSLGGVTTVSAGSVPVLTDKISSHGKTTAVTEDGRALPINTPVLVRQEAAAEAHRFRRENQGATDEHANRPNPVSEWIENHPVFMMATGLVLLIALVVMTTLLMKGWLSDEGETAAEGMTGLGSTLIQSSDFTLAEQTAHAFLAARTLAEARPLIYQAAEIEPQLQSYYEPIAAPADYRLVFKSRETVEDRSVYFFQVSSAKETLPLIVLQAGEEFRVFWQFAAGVGDVSWPDFLQEEPEQPVLMRALLRPDSYYDTTHLPEMWSSWMAEDWSGSHRARVYCLRGSKEERRLIAALNEHSILRSKNRWVMVQVRLRHLGTRSGSGIYIEETAKIQEVVHGSWLPPEFVSGSTFYSEKDKIEVREP